LSTLASAAYGPIGRQCIN